MKNGSLILVNLWCVLLLYSCGSAKNEIELNTETKAYSEIKDLIVSKSFRFNAASAYPIQSSDVINVTNALMRQTENLGGQISLSGNEDFLTINGDSAIANLSYFGELRTVAYSDARDNNIIFDTNHITYDIDENDKKKRIHLNFKAKNATEEFQIKMVVFPNHLATISIYGSNRVAIRYRGEIISLAK